MTAQQQLVEEPTDESPFDRPEDALSTFPYGGRHVARTAPTGIVASGTPPCPDCGATPINAQGLLDCPDCDWLETR